MPRDDSTVTDLDELFAASRAVRRPFEPDAYLNIAFFSGRQWTRWDGSMVADVFVDDGREMEVDNRILPIVQTAIAKMTKTRPKYVAVPRTAADDDIAAARYGELALDDAWKKQDLQRKLRAALLWSRTTGAGFWKTTWDSQAGKSKDVLVYGDEHPQAGKLVRTQSGAPLPVDQAQNMPQDVPVKQTSIGMGDMCVELRSFFHMFPDPACTEEGMESASWAGEEAVYSRDYVKLHFPDDYDTLRFNADPQPGMLEAVIPSIGRSMQLTTTEAGKGIKLREYWSKDKHVIFVPGEKVLLEEANPYPWLPYVMFSGIPVPGRFWPDSIITHLRPRQVSLNKRLSQISEHIERVSNPKLLRSSSVADFEMTNLPGGEVVFTDTGSPNAVPRYLEPPELQATVVNDVERTEQSMMEISGQHEVTGASVPAGVTAASAISQLQEADDSRLGPDISDMEQAIADAGKRQMYLIRTYYTDERHMAVAGESGAWDVMAFRGEKFAGVDDVEVQSGSGMPESKAAKQAAIQQIMTLMTQNPQNGMTPRDWRKVLGEFQIGGLESFFATVQRDEQQVEDENRRISSGEQFPINSFDDDTAHIFFHNDFQKQARYAGLSPQIKQIMEAHVLAHHMRLAPPMAFPGALPGVPGAQAGPPQQGGQPPFPAPGPGGDPSGPPVPSGQQ